jgi:2-succinyl-6-hydroxy-2,4-cyclohexadiene-1-carboxylate synthase
VVHIRRFGTGANIVALHGFSLTGEQFSPVADSLDRHVIAPDLPGHGSSRSHPADVDSVTAAIDVLLDELGRPTPLMGYSQGGRMALLTAIGDHSNVSSLVLISSSPGIRDVAERESRIERDHVLADRIRDIGVEAFIDSWTSAGTTTLAHLDEAYRVWDSGVRSENSADGLASALRGYGQGAQPSAWDELGNLTMPVLLIVGSLDERYRSINDEMADLIPGAELVVIDGARHNPLADEPVATCEAISRFLDRHR